MEQLMSKIFQEIKKTHNAEAFRDLKNICRETLKTNVPLGVEYLLKLSEECESIIPFVAERDLQAAKDIMGIHIEF